MHEQIERFATEPTDDELFDEIEEHVERSGIEIDMADVLDALAQDRR